MFKELPPEDEDETETSFATSFLLKGSKVLAYATTFALVLCGSAISKATLLLMTSEIRTTRTAHNQTRNHCYNEIHDLADHVPEIDKAKRISWMWVILFTMLVPEILTVLRALWTCMFQDIRVPRPKTFLLVFVLESLHVIGVCLLVLEVLPYLDAQRAVLVSSCVAVVPALLASLSHRGGTSPRNTVLNCLAVLAQCSGIVLWSIGDRGIPLLAPAVLLASCAWWECFADENAPVFRLVKLEALKRDLERSRLFTSIVLPLWRMLLVFAATLALATNSLASAPELFSNFQAAFQWAGFKTCHTGGFVDEAGMDHRFCERGLPPVAVAAVHVGASYIAYRACVFACRVKMQSISVALPLTISGPVMAVLMTVTCILRVSPEACAGDEIIPLYMRFDCYEGSCSQFFAREHAWLCIIWALSFAWLTAPVWKSWTPRMAAEESIFARPSYTSALLEQSVALNIRRPGGPEKDEKSQGWTVEDTIGHSPGDDEANSRRESRRQSQLDDGDDVTRIYACATMWHETKDEMLQLLKSLLRMDYDQSARRLSRLRLRIKVKLYYAFEAHIIFDDAFRDGQDAGGQKGRVINDYVRTLINTVNEAACSVYGLNDICLPPPLMLDTPYGGRLEWTMPGRNPLVVHLKDRARIRNKKRWSQVMYMYYLLGHRLQASPIEDRRKQLRKSNTYILALDGDISFRPESVLYLLDHMKNNPKLGAACGRVHPTGSGPMVWYQKFEYAVGHWLQKSTEHVLGCVLCSPGCFSLFRSEALMADNVLRTYTTKSTEAKHFVQYDQGEDRWLCTLLLKQGYHVEYSAASDAYTRCPESFEEFFTQRRRWTPSTMANILDILMDARKTTRNNGGISHFYMAYQGMLTVGTLLGPGTIFLMLIGAFVTCFGVSNLTALAINALPVLAFVVTCFGCSQTVQMLVAQVLSAAYALLMAAVVVGVALQIREDGMASPASIFFVATALIFIISALVHPQEVGCLVHGLLYFLLVPAMYLILALYSIINLNVVSWGTRETSSSSTQKTADPLLNSGGSRSTRALEALMTCRIGDIVTCFWCPQKKTDTGARTSSFRATRGVAQGLEDIRDCRIPLLPVGGTKLPALIESEESGDEATRPVHSGQPEHSKKEGESPEHSIWRSHPTLRHGVHVLLQEDEKDFWRSLIKDFLQPEQQNDASKVRELQGKLDVLRNRVASIVLFCNTIYVLVIVLLQHHRSNLYLVWPLGASVRIGYVPASENVIVHTDSQHLEPIGVVFVAFFAFILLLQLWGMMLHQFHTFSHLLASISIVDSSKSKANDADWLSAFRELQMPDTLDDLLPPAQTDGEESWRMQRTVDLEFVLDRNWNNVKTGNGLSAVDEADTWSRDAVVAKLQRRLSDPSVLRRSRRYVKRASSFYS